MSSPIWVMTETEGPSRVMAVTESVAMKWWLRIVIILLAYGLTLFQLWNVVCSEARKSGGEWSRSLDVDTK